MFVTEKETKGRPQTNGVPPSQEERRGIFKIRQTTVFILIFITVLTIQLIAVWEFYKKSKNMRNNINLTGTVQRHEVTNLAKLQFDSFMRDFNKSYKHEEYVRRFENFQASIKDIARLNKLENNTVFGLTKFSDMSKKEFADRMLLKPRPGAPAACQDLSYNCTKLHAQTEYKLKINKKYGKNIPPPSFDWRLEGVVKPVLNQKRCHGCWAFSIVGVLESMSAIELNDYSSRSIEELIDCLPPPDNSKPEKSGCYTGSVTKAMKYICNNSLQFVTEEEYPLTLSMEKNCKLQDGYRGPKVEAFQHICRMDEKEMVKKIATHGPLIVAVDGRNWANYIGGVITRACTRGMANHVVQVVGYVGSDKDTPIPYYIVRNSLGEDWGDNGYAKIAMNHTDARGDQVYNVCGIAEQVTIMDVKHPD